MAIYTLTAAAHQLLTDLKQASSGAPMLKDTLLSHVRPNKINEARRLLKAATNYFKHANRDSNLYRGRGINRILTQLNCPP